MTEIEIVLCAFIFLQQIAFFGLLALMRSINSTTKYTLERLIEIVKDQASD